MNDFTIDACRWIVDAEQSVEFKQRALERYRLRWEPLLAFLVEEGLIVNSTLAQPITDWMAFSIKKSDLSALGYELFRICHHKWVQGTDRGTNPANITRWKRELEKLRAKSDIHADLPSDQTEQCS